MRDDLELLKETLKYKDVGWEARLKTALAVFMEGSELCKDGSVGISIVNGVLLPCLEIIQQQTTHSSDSPGIRFVKKYQFLLKIICKYFVMDLKLN